MKEENMRTDNGNPARILVYTRRTTGAYPQGLAGSAYFAVSRSGNGFEPLNGNYGILFAKGTISDDNTIQAKGIKNPWIFAMPGGYGIAAIRITGDGSPDPESRGKILLFTTTDFTEFTELGLLSLNADTDVSEVQCRYCPETGACHILWKARSGKGYYNTTDDIRSLTSVSKNPSFCSMKPPSGFQAPEGGFAGNTVEISGNLCDRLALRWNKLTCTGLRVPKHSAVRSAADVDNILATAVYSDGSTAQKQMSWDTKDIDFTKPEIHRICGTVKRHPFAFPLACGYGDPVIFPWEGRYYFISTNDNKNDIGLYVREADSIAGLFVSGIQEHLILGQDEDRGLIQTFWAPEFHVIGGALYILFAVSGSQWGPQCHLMQFRKGGRITDSASWEDPVRIKRKDGSFLAQSGITLDMTYLHTTANSYMIWSYRKHIGTEMDTGSMLYIAAVSPLAPFILTSEPVLLSRPLYGWENVEHTINNEGPYAFISGGKIHLTYSGGSANSFTYALGLLTADADADLLNPSAWSKRIAPVCSYYSVKGEYGPGHNSFFTDDQGNLMIAYHAEDALDHNTRCVGIRRVHIDINGQPVLDMSADEDLPPEFAYAEMDIRIDVEEPLN